MAEARLRGDPRRRRPAREHRAVARHVRAGVRRAPALPRARPTAQARPPRDCRSIDQACTCCPRSASRRPSRTSRRRTSTRSASSCSPGSARAPDRAEDDDAARRHPRAARSGRAGSPRTRARTSRRSPCRRTDEFNVLTSSRSTPSRARRPTSCSRRVHGRGVHRAAAGRVARAALAPRRLREPHPARPAEPPPPAPSGGHARSRIASAASRCPTRPSSRSTGSAGASTSPAPDDLVFATSSASTSTTTSCATRSTTRSTRPSSATCARSETRSSSTTCGTRSGRMRGEGDRPSPHPGVDGSRGYPDDDAVPALRAAARRRRPADRRVRDRELGVVDFGARSSNSLNPSCVPRPAAARRRSYLTGALPPGEGSTLDRECFLPREGRRA